MIRATFAVGVLLSLASAGVLALNFIAPPPGKRRHPGSLVVGYLALGWGVALAREMNWLPRAPTTVMIAGSLPFLFLALLILVNSRRQA